MGSIRRHKNAMSALLAEFYDKPNNNLEFDEFDDYIVNKKRREDEGSAGGMCQSVVRYARPQKAKAASGEWKYIVNTGQHTQTLRLEKCSNPGDSCSYLAQTYRSHCAQVYNYHRLLSWDKVRGLHVDIFKVPTCCSCQVDGYRQQFPPLASIQSKDYSPGSYKVENGNSNGYSTINEEDLDYNDESDEDELGSSYSPYNSRDTNELSYLGSKKVRSKLPAPSSVGPYLSPPDDEEQFGGYKSHKSSSSPTYSSSSSSKKYYSQLSRRRPQQNEPRVDVALDLSPSETQAEQEVNVFGPPLAGEQPQQRVSLKRKRAATIGVSISAATHAHQEAAVPSGTIASSNIAVGQGQHTRYYTGGKSRPRYYAPITTTTVAAAPTIPASAATPLPTTFYQQKQQQQSTAFPQPSHVNSIYGNGNGNGIGNGNGNGTRRINYSYHPIIDFFEKNRRAEAAAAVTSTQATHDTDTDTDNDYVVEEESRLVEQRYPHRTPAAAVGMGVYQHAIPTPHERRIGFGAGGAGGAAGGGGVAGGGIGGAASYGFANDNAWQPLVVDH
ncbi:neurotrophin 1-like [Drosophila innubila]|uniref:neurotrophin 1-like n=1 Tax=Drosophila innubila TaxID=198719 RepID=UPI00148D98C1|nr:neurotrophin 1-like [Drosophila innubila]